MFTRTELSAAQEQIRGLQADLREKRRVISDLTVGMAGLRAELQLAQARATSAERMLKRAQVQARIEERAAMWFQGDGPFPAVLKISPEYLQNLELDRAEESRMYHRILSSSVVPVFETYWGILWMKETQDMPYGLEIVTEAGKDD